MRLISESLVGGIGLKGKVDVALGEAVGVRQSQWMQCSAKLMG